MSEVANIPQLRFPEFSGQWEEKKLGDVANIIMGQSPDSKSYNVNAIGVYLIQGNADIEDRKTAPRIWTTSPTKECKVGDIIMTVRAPVGAVAKSEHNACIGRGVCVIRNNQHGVSNYIYQLLLDFENKWAKFEQGSTFTAVNTKDVKSLKLNFPTLPEQQKIAAFLTSVDNKIEQLSKKQELLKEYKKGLMQQIFSQTTRFKADDGSDFPDWEEKKLSDVATILMGQSPESKTYNSNAIGTYLIQGNADIRNRRTAPRIWTDSPTKECKVGDIIMTVRAPVGAVAKSEHNACIGRGVCAFRSNQQLSSNYLYQFLINYENNWAKFGQGSTFDAINSNDIKFLKLKLPSKSEQQKIANLLSSVDNKIEQVGEQLNESKQFKKALLQQMFV